MATIIQRGDKWRVQIRLRGVMRSKTFERHGDAKAWAARMESMIHDGIQGNAPRHLAFKDIAARYLKEVTPQKRGSREEAYRIGRILQSNLAFVPVPDLRPQDFADWRDHRLKEVSSATVNRELTTISAICNHVLKEWGLLNDNPVLKISKPKTSKARTRRPTQQEIKDICNALLLDEERKPELLIQRVALAMLFAIETAMRAGEICGMMWDDVHLSKRIAHLRMTKNGESRDVPLSLRAVAIINQLEGIHEQSVFAVDVKTLDVLFRRARDKCEIVDLHFHDTRREALTRMSKKVPVEMLAKISGHKDLRILLNVYYRPEMSDIASMLD